MEKINLKFSQYNTEFIIELREQVKEYFEKNKISKYGNAGIVLKSVLMVILYFIPYLLMMTGVVTSVYFIFICWILMGFGMAGIGMVLMHDANHGSYSKSPRVNKWLGKSLYILGGFPQNWLYQHNTLHHGYTNIDGHDEDIDPVGILRFSPHKPLRSIHKYQYLYAWFLYSLMTLSWVTAKDFSRLLNYKRSGAPTFNKQNFRRYLLYLIIGKIIYYTFLLVLPILLIQQPWYLILCCFLIMHFIGGLILSTIFQTAHVMPDLAYPLPDPDGKMENNWAIHQVLSTSDFSPSSRIFSWLIGGLNYQIEHHLFPNISHVHYKQLSALVVKATQKYDLPYYVHVNFISAIRNHIKMLKILGEKQ